MSVETDASRTANRRLEQVFRFLKDLNQHSNPAVLTLDDQPWTLWLDDLPDHPTITKAIPQAVICASEAGAPDNDAQRTGGSEVVLTVARPKITRPPEPPSIIREWLLTGWDDPRQDVGHHESLNIGRGELKVVRFADDAERSVALDHWRLQREQWRKPELLTRRALKVFERLYEVYGHLGRENEKYELVLGDGVLSWARELQSVYHPVLLQRVQLQFDTQKPEFTISYSDTSPELYTGVFQAIPEIEGRRIQDLRQQIDDSGIHPLASEADGYFRQFAVVLSSQGEFVEDKRPPRDSPSPTFGRAPVLFLRSRTLGYSQAIDDAIRRVTEAKDLCVGLQSIVGCHSPVETVGDEVGEVDDWRSEIGHADILFGKPSNLEQLQIATRLERHGAVIVQGPPGTGKSHTIANLIGHLLAQNKSILVTSHTSKALRVLRNHVVEPLRPLCVSVLERDAQSRDELKESVEAIQERLSHSDVNELERQAIQLAKERKQLLERLERAQSDLLHVRTGEFRDIVANGEAISPSAAARLVAQGKDQDHWIPGPLPLDAPVPLQESELVELYATNGSTTIEDDDYVWQQLPNLFQLLQPRDFNAAVEAARQLAVPIGRREAELWANLQFTGGTLQVIESSMEAFRELCDELAQFAGWQCDALGASVGEDSEREVWSHLVAKIEEVTQLVGASTLSRIRFSPTIESTAEIPSQIVIAQEIANHLKDGGQLSWFILATKPRWKRAIRGWRVMNQSPSKADHFEAIRAQLAIVHQRQELSILWDGLIANRGERPFEEIGVEPEKVCDSFRPDIARVLNWWSHRVASNVDALKQVGFQWEVLLSRQPPNPGPSGKLNRFFSAVSSQLLPHLHEIANRLRQSIRRNRLEQQAQLLQGSTVPTVAALYRSTASQNTDEYERALQELANMSKRRPKAIQRMALLDRLEKHAPTWAAGVRQRAGVHGSAAVPGDTARAWKWRQIHDELRRRDSLDADTISSEVERLRFCVKDCTIRLIEKKAWAGQVKRTDQEQKQALFGWADTIKKLGAGHVKRASQLMANARECMKKCRQAVPVWIVPVARLAECFDFSATQFDIVIIDEASQCDLMGLLALTLAKQVIIVGDHEQVSPSAVGQSMDVVTSLINQHLEGIPNKELYDGRTSVYHLARQSFGGMICLREHFRCVPEIIEFSNNLCYQGRIKALRDPTSSPVVPSIVPLRVEGASRDGKVNETEVLAIASLLTAALRHEAYVGQSFGVISLLGDDQAYEIDGILRQRLTPEEYHSRRIICGNPAQFQGDERDVIFLSMVDVPGEGPLRLRRDDSSKQRINVATSRARNQLWVVHSLDKERDLQADDLRRLLLEHASDPQAARRALKAVQDRTESEFELQVLQRLIASRYRVIPQWEVGAYRIDFVIEGKRSRLAVECDGDRFHPIEQLPQDMGRQAILERLGWRFHRMRGSAFFREPDAAMAKLFAKLTAMEIYPETGQSVEHETSSDVIEDVKRIAFALRQEWAAIHPDSEGTDEVQEASDIASNGRQVNRVGDAIFHEAWQLPFAEWKRLREQLRDAGDQEALVRIGGAGHEFAHKVQVMKALQRGEVIPNNVLHDYPDLQNIVNVVK